MNKLNIEVTKTEETNPYYDSRKSRNGGGYSQPEIEFEFDGGKGVLSNLSCGDFGTRYFLNLTIDGQEYSARWGTMKGFEELSNIHVCQEKLVAIVHEIEEYFGFEKETIPLDEYPYSSTVKNWRDYPYEPVYKPY